MQSVWYIVASSSRALKMATRSNFSGCEQTDAPARGRTAGSDKFANSSFRKLLTRVLESQNAGRRQTYIKIVRQHAGTRLVVVFTLRRVSRCHPAQREMSKEMRYCCLCAPHNLSYTHAAGQNSFFFRSLTIPSRAHTQCIIMKYGGIVISQGRHCAACAILFNKL